MIMSRSLIDCVRDMPIDSSSTCSSSQALFAGTFRSKTVVIASALRCPVHRSTIYFWSNRLTLFWEDLHGLVSLSLSRGKGFSIHHHFSVHDSQTKDYIGNQSAYILAHLLVHIVVAAPFLQLGQVGQNGLEQHQPLAHLGGH